MWAFGLSAPMGPIDAADGLSTLRCPECGASANPVPWVKEMIDAPEEDDDAEGRKEEPQDRAGRTQERPQAIHIDPSAGEEQAQADRAILWEDIRRTLREWVESSFLLGGAIEAPPDPKAGGPMKQVTWEPNKFEPKPTLMQRFEKWFLRIRDAYSHRLAHWQGWQTIETHEGILDQWRTLGVKQYRDGFPYGAYTRITEEVWPCLTAWDKLAILRVLRDRAVLLPEGMEIAETQITFTTHGWGPYPVEEVRLR